MSCNASKQYPPVDLPKLGPIMYIIEFKKSLYGEPFVSRLSLSTSEWNCPGLLPNCVPNSVDKAPKGYHSGMSPYCARGHYEGDVFTTAKHTY